MEVRYATRKQPWLAACQVAPASCAQVIPRLATLMVPFVEPCCRQALTQHAPPSLCGLRSDVERKNVAAIAYRFGPDRLPLPRCMGWAPGADAPVRQALTRPGAAPLGHAEGVWVCAPSGCPTSGTESGGGAPVVQPPGPGRPLARRPLLGRRVGRGPSPGRHAPVLAHSMDHGQGPPRQSWRAQRPQRVARAAPVGVGHVADQWQAAAAGVERWRGREGASVLVSSPAGGRGRAL